MSSWDLGVHFARDDIDDRIRRQHGEDSVKAALLMFDVRLTATHLFCGLITLDRDVPEQQLTITLHLEAGATRDVRIHWDFDARGRKYRDGKFPIINQEATSAN